jgi:hypothetical protein
LKERYELYSHDKKINKWKEISKSFLGKNPSVLKERFYELQTQTSLNTKETIDISSIPLSTDD